jgi:quercetin dioxygenase-like cupin family protein
MSVQQPVLTAAHSGETVTSSGGSIVDLKVESSQSGGDYGVVLWTVRAGEEPPLHTHSREDELLYVVQGQLIARVGDARVEVGPGAYAALPRGVSHTIEVVGDQATLCSASCCVGLSASWSHGKASGPTRPLSA